MKRNIVAFGHKNSPVYAFKMLGKLGVEIILNQAKADSRMLLPPMNA